MAVKTCGSDFLLQIFRAGAWETVAHQKDTAGNGTDELVDVTDKQDSIKYRFALPGCGVRAVQITASGYSNNSLSFDYLHTSFGTQHVQARLFSDGVTFWESEYKITQFVRQGTYNGAEEFSLVLESANTVNGTTPPEECTWFDADGEAIADTDGIGICVVAGTIYIMSASASGGTPNELIVCISSTGAVITDVATAGSVVAGPSIWGTITSDSYITGGGTDTLCIHYPTTFIPDEILTQFDVLIDGVPISGGVGLLQTNGVRSNTYVFADTTGTLHADFVNFSVVDSMNIASRNIASGQNTFFAGWTAPALNQGDVILSGAGNDHAFDLAKFIDGTHPWPFVMEVFGYDARIGAAQTAQATYFLFGGPSFSSQINNSPQPAAPVVWPITGNPAGSGNVFTFSRDSCRLTIYPDGRREIIAF